MAVAVKGELRATRLLMPDNPQYCCPFLLIECFTRINEDKYPVLFLGVILLEDAHGMNVAIYPCLHAPGQLVCPAGRVFAS